MHAISSGIAYLPNRTQNPCIDFGLKLHIPNVSIVHVHVLGFTCHWVMPKVLNELWQYLPFNIIIFRLHIELMI